MTRFTEHTPETAQWTQGNSKCKNSIPNHRKRINYSTSNVEITSWLFAKSTKLKAIKSLLHTSHTQIYPSVIKDRKPKITYKQDQRNNLWGRVQNKRRDIPGGNSRELNKVGKEMGGLLATRKVTMDYIYIQNFRLTTETNQQSVKTSHRKKKRLQQI